MCAIAHHGVVSSPNAHLSDAQSVIAEAEKAAKAIVAKAGLSHRLAPAWRM